VARSVENRDVADLLERVGDLLERQGANHYRVRAYRRAADTARAHGQPLSEVLGSGGRGALEALPGIGSGIASAIEEIVHTGRLRMLDRLAGEVSPEDLFTTVPGIGEGLAHAIHDRLGIETLEELELAAHDGRLSTVPGFGERRVRAVRETLASMLSRSSRRRARRVGGDVRGAAARPPVGLLLSVDARYRREAAAGRLRRIAPRRFNPEGEAWLPIMHVDEDGWHLHAMFSNTALAHHLGRTDDWVVVYWERDGHEDQCTVVTEHAGPLAGRRVVRSREQECAAHYGEASAG